MAKVDAARVLKRVVVISVCLLALGGCVPEQHVPTIVDSHRSGTIIRYRKPARALAPVNNRSNAAHGWIPPARIERKWTAIIVHHSVTSSGNVALFDKYHREEKHWDSIGYDFVIGNGKGSGDGQIEVTVRWRKQKTGAHCKTSNNWANERGIGICLVGDFNNNRPTRKQMASLIRLTRFMQKRYNIPNNRIYGHKNTPGAGVTDCPGKRFPMGRFKAML